MSKWQQKREKPLEKAWYIVKPFLTYTIIKTLAIFGLALLMPSIPISAFSVWVENNSQLLSTTINGIAALIAVAFVLREFVKEIAISGEIDIDSGVCKQIWNCIKNGMKQNKGKEFQLAAVVSLGITASFALNLLVELLAISTDKYESVEALQYSVPLWLGLILYGIIAPVTEEIIFRGITYNRMKRFFGVLPCVLVTSLLFGGFHANLPQFLYGTCMGILLALSYEWVKTFAAPLLLHMAANIFVFGFSFVGITLENQEKIVCFGIFGVLSVLLIVYLRKKK